MISLASLLTRDFLRHLELVAGDPAAIQISTVEFAEHSSDLINGFTQRQQGAALGEYEDSHESLQNDAILGPKQRGGRLVVFGRTLSELFAAELLPDVAIGELAALGVRAIVLTGAQRPVGMLASTERLIDHLGLAVLSASEDLGVATLLSRIDSALVGDAEQALRRVHRYLDSRGPRRAAESSAAPGTDEILALASHALDASVTLESADRSGVPVGIEGARIGRVSVPTRSGVDGLADRIVAEFVALHIEQAVAAGQRSRSGTRLSADTLLSELIVASEDHAVRLTQHARNLGVPIDGWLRTFVFQSGQSEQLWSPSLFTSLGEAALAPLTHPEQWLVTRSEGSLILVQSWPEDPRPLEAAADVAGLMLDSLEKHLPTAGFRCGIGSAHEGVTGLRVSIAEARTALGQSRRNRIARYDQAGLRPIIVDLANATASRASAREMLAPILALDAAKAKEIVQTLQIYLDEQSSLARTAERLLLHRNTVAYRVRRAKSLLDNELDDSDQRLALQLACRTYLLEQSAAA